MTENDGNDKLRAVAWSEVLPWLSIFRTFRLAISFRVLLAGAVAVLLTALVWGGLAWLVLPEAGSEAASLAEPRGAAWVESYRQCPWLAVTALVPDQPVLLARAEPAAIATLPGEVRPEMIEGEDYTRALMRPWIELSRPLWSVFHPHTSLRELVCVVLCGLAAVAIWGFFGGVITRMVAVQLAADEQISTMAAVRFACRKWPAYCAAPLLPVGGIAGLAFLLWIGGLIMRAGLGVVLGGLLWPIALVFAAIMAVLLLGLMFGWPLMWPTISTEGTDSFDALSRAYAYVFHRPLHYLFYVLVAGLLGALGWLLVQNFASGAVWLAYWGAGWGCGSEQIQRVMAPLGSEQAISGVGYVGAVLIQFWAGCVKLLAVGFLYGFFWAAMTSIYLLLRRDVDATAMDEVFLDADESEPAEGLPPISADQAGAPELGPAPPAPEQPLAPPPPPPPPPDQPPNAPLGA